MPPDASRPAAAPAGFLIHLHPRTVPAHTLRFTLSFGLGGMAATLTATLLVTGLLQLLSYSPDPGQAYDSIVAMYGSSSPAGFIRNIHHWSGNLLVIVAVLHLLRVFLTGGCSSGRRLNWLIGLATLTLILFGNFTGYLLPWDQLAYWAVTIFVRMIEYIPLFGEALGETVRGGDEVGSATLSHFFAMHIGLIPVLLVILLIYHFWLIRKAGGLVLPAEPPGQARRRVRSVPALVVREAAVGLTLLALLFCFAALIDAPLAEPANPGESPNPAKAAWYFMGLQELLLHVHPTVAVCVIPLLVLGLFALIPFWPGAVLPPGIWCGGRSGRIAAAAAGGAGFLLSFPLVLADELTPAAVADGAAAWLARGLLPVLAIVFVNGAVYLVLHRFHAMTKSICVMVVVLLNLGVIAGLTVIGVWLRGPGMALSMPF